MQRKNSSETTFEENNSNFKKKTLDGQRLPTKFDRKPAIRNKIHRKGVSTPKTKQQGGKRNIVIRDTIPTLSVYYKGTLNDKSGSYLRPTITSTNFYRTTYHFLTRNEDH